MRPARAAGSEATRSISLSSLSSLWHSDMQTHADACGRMRLHAPDVAHRPACAPASRQIRRDVLWPRSAGTMPRAHRPAQVCTYFLARGIARTCTCPSMYRMKRKDMLVVLFKLRNATCTDPRADEFCSTEENLCAPSRAEEDRNDEIAASVVSHQQGGITQKD